MPTLGTPTFGTPTFGTPTLGMPTLGMPTFGTLTLGTLTLVKPTLVMSILVMPILVMSILVMPIFGAIKLALARYASLMGFIIRFGLPIAKLKSVAKFILQKRGKISLMSRLKKWTATKLLIFGKFGRSPF